ncbi:MAG TPA: hypothetical protein VGD51_08855 [Nocardioidaceae bacterium]
MGAALETLAKHRRPIAILWWFGFLGGPVWLVVLAVVVRRRHTSRTLRWIV